MLCMATVSPPLNGGHTQVFFTGMQWEIKAEKCLKTTLDEDNVVFQCEVQNQHS